MTEKKELPSPEEFVDGLLFSFREDILKLYQRLEDESSTLKHQFDAIELKTQKELERTGLSAEALLEALGNIDEEEREKLLTQEWINSLLIKNDAEDKAIDQLRDHLIFQIHIIAALVSTQLCMDFGMRAMLINKENLRVIMEIIKTVQGPK